MERVCKINHAKYNASVRHLVIIVIIIIIYIIIIIVDLMLLFGF